MSTTVSILDIGEKVTFDDSIESIEVHPYNPYNDSYNNNDLINICINRQDLMVLPCQSQLLVEGTINKECTFINNAIAYLFQDIRYELNGVEIDRSKNCGITSTMKGLVSYSKGSDNALENAGWNVGTIKEITDGDFSFTIPLSHLLGFAEDYKKIIMNAKHELILNRANTNINCATITTTPPGKHIDVKITRIVWRMPVIKVSDKEKLRLMTHIESGIPIPIAFRTWDLYEYPLLPTAQKHVWTIKTATQLEKPRFVIIGFQIARKNVEAENMSEFDHCNLTDCRVYLNSQYYPYTSFAADFKKSSFPLLYDAYASFQQAYYGDVNNPQLNPAHYKTKAPLVVINTSRQCDSYGTGPIDIKVEMEFKENVSTATTAYCLIINDSLFEYSALNGTVRKVIQ